MNKLLLHIKKCFVVTAMTLCAGLACAQGDIVVAADGTGNFTNIQDAINSLPKEATNQRVIFIKEGVYKEKLFIESNFITLKGAGANKTQIIFSEARDIFRCDHADDWGVATLNLKGNDITLEDIAVINNYGFEAKGDETIPCAADSIDKTKLVKKNGHQMALRSFTTTRLIVRNCIFRALGGDTVSPWNTEDGMFYFSNCIMEGGVDFYCPRGWALAENCEFICHNKEAAIWHDGSKHISSKTVLINCNFRGDDGFKLGRYHRDAQFYLVNCKFPTNMADADIYQKAANPTNVIQWGKRVYYFNCHREGGDYAWHANNLPDSFGVNDINVPWVYDYKWNPVKGKEAATDDSVIVDSVKAAPGSTSDAVADNMLLYQRKNGGWPKHFEEQKVDYKHQLTAAELKVLKDGYKESIDATIDNEATTKEIKYLVKAYRQTNNKEYLEAAQRGIEYLLKAQYKNGGWPQYYPDASSYRGQITYNDNAMVNVLNVLQDFIEGKNDLDAIDPKYLDKSKTAVTRGISCILKTQVKQKKTLTAWCQQHDAYTLAPTNARKFELVSLSGAETVGILRFLMRLDQPSKEIIAAITGGIEWLNKVAVRGYKYSNVVAPNERSGRDRILVADSNAVIWARFYDVDNNQPFFCGRDGIRKANLADIENERRIGYAWYGTWGQKLLEKEYPEWALKWINKN